MADVDVDELGPVDYLVVEFPPGASDFTGEMAKELARLIDAGTIRLLDLLILAKDTNGEVEAMEIEDLDQLERTTKSRDAARGLASGRGHCALGRGDGAWDGRRRARWENAWAAPFATAARRSGGQLVASGRIPIQAIAASLQAEE